MKQSLSAFRKRFSQDSHFRFLVWFYAIVFLVHLFLPMNWSDDKIFFSVAKQTPLSVFLSTSARPIIDTATYLFARVPFLWRCLNPLMLFLSARLLIRYIGLEGRFHLQKCICICTVLLSMTLVDAGFMATTLNYLWPTTFALISFLPLWKYINGSAVRLYEILPTLPCILYAANMQQMAVVMTVVFLVAFLWFLFLKKPHFSLGLQWLFSCFSLGYSYYLNTAGENSRMLMETANYFPAFSSLNLLQKAELGFSSTLFCMIAEFRFAFAFAFLFLALLCILKWKTSTNRFGRVMGCIPLAFSLICPFFLLFAENTALSDFIFCGFRHFRSKQATYIFAPMADLLFLLLTLCICYNIFTLLSSKKERLVAFALLTLGFGTRLMMGFSPTVWASGYRTFYLFFLSLLIVAILILKRSPFSPFAKAQKSDS